MLPSVLPSVFRCPGPRFDSRSTHSRSTRGTGVATLTVAVIFGVLGLFGAGGFATGTAIAAEIDFEDLLSPPFPSGMVASEAGAFAWVLDTEGVRNVWVAEPPEYRSRVVTEFAEDDGQELTGLEFSPGGERLAFVRGGAPNSRGELPNPTSDPEGVESAVWVIELAAGSSAARRLVEGYAPLWRDDERLLLEQRGKVVELAVPIPDPQSADRGEAAETSDDDGGQPEILIDLRGNTGVPRFSPDRTRLAFVSQRGSHSYVGVYEFASRSVRWIDPSLDRDDSPVWSPDGEHIAFLRIPAQADRRLFSPQRTGWPWSIRVADADTGRSREVWRSSPGYGSVFHSVVATDQLWWTQGDRLTFPWEHGGWLHLWSLDLSQLGSESGSGTLIGTEARQLTSGEFEVESVAPDPDGRTLVVSSNQDDIDRRHLWRVDPATGTVLALTSGDGMENIPVPARGPAGPVVGYLRSDGLRPLSAAVLVGEKVETRDLGPALPPGFPLASMVEPEPVLFRSSDGLEIHGQLFRPPSSFEGPRPALVFMHGGPRRQMLLGWHYSSYYHHTYAFNQAMASRGWMVLSVNYRAGIGYGLEFREALDYGATGASELNDILGAGLWLADQPEVDPRRMALWGGSYGGYLTALGLARASHLFAGGVDVHGVHDWNKTIKNFFPDYEPLRDPPRARLAFESSPMASVDTWQSPVLLVHGDDDRNVPFTESVELIEQLREQGVDAETLVFPDEVHGFLRHHTWKTIFERAEGFLERRVERAAPPLRPGQSAAAEDRRTDAPR